MDKSTALQEALRDLLALTSDELLDIVNSPSSDYLFSDLAKIESGWSSFNFSRIMSPVVYDMSTTGRIFFSSSLVPSATCNPLFTVEEEYAWAA